MSWCLVCYEEHPGNCPALLELLHELAEIPPPTRAERLRWAPPPCFKCGEPSATFLESADRKRRYAVCPQHADPALRALETTTATYGTREERRAAWEWLEGSP